MSDLRIKVTPSFEKKALKLLSEVSFDALLDFLEVAPESGNIIKGSGDIRKLRWQSGKDNKGKSGGLRVLYHYSKGLLVLLIMIYRKVEKENITQAECNELRRLLPELLRKYRED